MITAEGLTRRFGDFTAVDALDLEVHEGEVLGFLGPNGAGKTTTVRMLTTLIAPTSGTATIDGFTVGREDHAIRRRVGILTETPGLYDNLSAAKNLALFAELYGVDDVDGQVEKYLKLVGLWERRHEAAGGFSKGMRQKLAIARCLLHEPRVVFLDEPTSGLDPQATQRVRDFVLELKAQGRTLFLCTHNLYEAERLCDRVAVFRHRLREIDTPARLRGRLFGREIAVELGSPAEPFAATARAVGGVEEVRAEGTVLRVRLADPEAVNPAVVRALVQAGAEVRFVTEVRRSLEDVYLALVGEEA